MDLSSILWSDESARSNATSESRVLHPRVEQRFHTWRKWPPALFASRQMGLDLEPVSTIAGARSKPSTEAALDRA